MMFRAYSVSGGIPIPSGLYRLRPVLLSSLGSLIQTQWYLDGNLNSQKGVEIPLGGWGTSLLDGRLDRLFEPGLVFFRRRWVETVIDLQRHVCQEWGL